MGRIVRFLFESFNGLVNCYWFVKNLKRQTTKYNKEQFAEELYVTPQPICEKTGLCNIFS